MVFEEVEIVDKTPIIERIAERLIVEQEKVREKKEDNSAQLSFTEFEQIITQIRIHKNDAKKIIEILEKLGIAKRDGQNLIIL